MKELLLYETNNLFQSLLHVVIFNFNLFITSNQEIGGEYASNNKVHLGVTAESREILTSIRIIDINGAANI